MKIWVICSSASDLHLFNVLNAYGHEYVVFLDNRYGSRWQLSREDGVERLKLCMDTEALKWCDKLIVPPIYELYLEAERLKGWRAERLVLLLFQNYVKTHILPYSIVGKIWCIGFERHLNTIGKFWDNLTKDHQLTANQTKNRHFQKEFPLYKVKTDHRSVLYDLPRSRFVNKLIKIDLKKMKDYGIDTLLPLEYGYFKHQKTCLDTFHKKVRFHTMDKLESVVNELIKNNQSEYGISVCHTWDLDAFENNKQLMWLLGKGKNVEIKFQKVTST